MLKYNDAGLQKQKELLKAHGCVVFYDVHPPSVVYLGASCCIPHDTLSQDERQDDNDNAINCHCIFLCFHVTWCSSTHYYAVATM